MSSDSLSGKIAERAWKSITRLIPETRAGDRFAALLLFLAYQRRFPSRRMLFNDVLYRLKTSDEIVDPLRVFVTDKEFVKLYVKAVVGDRYNIPTLAVIRSIDALESFDFPETCVIKPTHGSGQILFRRNGTSVDLDLLRQWFRLNYYRAWREANYRNLKPKILVEPIIDAFSELRIFCYDGHPRLIKTNIDRRSKGITADFFELDWNALDVTIQHPRYGKVDRPGNLAEMLDVAARLARNFGFVRIDLFSDGENVFVGEITNCDNNACTVFTTSRAHEEVSRLIFGSGRPSRG